MKKICKGMAVFAIMMGLACMTSCVSVGELVGSMFGGGSSGNSGGGIVAMLDGRDSGAPYASIELRSNGKLEASKPNSMDKVKGKWESSRSTGSVENGDTITVTIHDKTGKGTVRQTSSKWVPLDPSTANSDKPEGDYTLTKYSINLGTFGTYNWQEKKYESNK